MSCTLEGRLLRLGMPSVALKNSFSKLHRTFSFSDSTWRWNGGMAGPTFCLTLGILLTSWNTLLLIRSLIGWRCWGQVIGDR